MYNQLFDLHAQLLKSLAHPRRLEIIQLIRDQELCVSDIHSMLDLPQANISQHLMILRDAGVVVTRRAGKQIYYQIADKKFIAASDLFRAILIDRHHDTQLGTALGRSMHDLLPLTHDPVCGMRVSRKTAGFTTIHQNQKFFFCASGCLKKFQEHPEKYVQS